MNMECRKKFIQEKLRTAPQWFHRALVVIYDRQTSQEKSQEKTIEDNGIGFSGVDAEILSSFARQYKERGFLSMKQTEILRRIMPRYWRQILDIAGRENIDSLIINQPKGAANAITDAVHA